MKKSITPSPFIVKIAIAITFLNTLIIFFVWPGVLQSLLLISSSTWNGFRREVRCGN
jgi:hypothetical protein